MFKLKLAVGGKHVQGSIQPGDALASIVKPLPTAAPVPVAEPAKPEVVVAPAAAAPAPAPAPAAKPAAAQAPSSSSSSSLGGITLAKVSLAPMGMSDRHGVPPTILFPRAKPLERTQLNLGPVALSSFNTTLPVARPAAAAPGAAPAAAPAAADAPKKKSKAKKAAAAAAAEPVKQDAKKPAPIDVAVATASSSSAAAANGNGVTSASTVSPVPSTPTTPSSTASGDAADGAAKPKKAAAAKKPKAEREIDSAVLRAGVTAGEYRATLRAYSADLITALCNELGVPDRRRNHLLTTLPASTLNAFVSRQNAAFAPLLTASAPAAAAAPAAAEAARS